MAEDKIGQIMSKPVRTVKPDDKLSAAVAVMDKNSIGSVVVLDGETAIGIITEGDVVEQVSKLREYELEAARIAAQIITLLNL